MARLSAQELADGLSRLEGWAAQGDAIGKTYRFADFVAAMAFVNRVADLAEAAGHHPDIDIRYNRVVIGLSTHDEGGVTEKDTALAAQIDAVV